LPAQPSANGPFGGIVKCDASAPHPLHRLLGHADGLVGNGLA
jgi:hypothetical protein